MNVVLWIIAGLLALAFLGAGLTKLTQPKEKLAASMAWVEDFSPGMVKLIGALEVLAAIGLVLPAALDVLPVLVPLAAVGLIALMIGAAITHARRSETPMIAVNVVLLLLAAVVAWGRFGPWSFTA
ncbi:DoxX family protein [Blastococcus sp. CT_GayMR20]|uniref:DoxX family protein n=1 Tax=Blastococcus sp. CT_GayMR20 TaxID=2559609 RepID=UPI001073985F|nr:DoxX family protein [Blastococcus sp. CT_GayMR20]TFV83267.1 DoxX family protein [Blastococcus sp. CT_GayMR20]